MPEGGEFSSVAPFPVAEPEPERSGPPNGPPQTEGRPVHHTEYLFLALCTLLALSFVPVPELAFVIQCVGVGGLVGTYVGLYRQHRHPATLPGVIILRWSALGGVLGVLGLLVDAVV